MSKKNLIEQEIEMDRGVTIDPRDYQVTEELIAKIEKRERMREILHDETLSTQEKFDKLNKSGLTIRSFSELRRLKVQLK